LFVDVPVLFNCIKDGKNIDPCCGSGGMFVQSEKFVEDHQGRV